MISPSADLLAALLAQAKLVPSVPVKPAADARGLLDQSDKVCSRCFVSAPSLTRGSCTSTATHKQQSLCRRNLPAAIQLP